MVLSDDCISSSEGTSYEFIKHWKISDTAHNIDMLKYQLNLATDRVNLWICVLSI